MDEITPFPPLPEPVLVYIPGTSGLTPLAVILEAEIQFPGTLEQILLHMRCSGLQVIKRKLDD